jgi:hypothetical protein
MLRGGWTERVALAARLAWLGVVLNVLSCGLVVSFDSYGRDVDRPEARLYGASGMIRGLSERELQKHIGLRFNSVVFAVVDRTGLFVVPPAVPDGVPWRLEALGSSCAVEPSSGVIAGGDVNGIEVRCESNEPLLKELSVRGVTSSGFVLDPPFAPTTRAYRLRRSDRNAITLDEPGFVVSASASRSGASVTIEDEEVEVGGRPAVIYLGRGENQIEVVVTSVVGSALYTIAVLIP